MIYLSLADAIQVMAAAIGRPPAVRDWGLLEAAIARPRTVVFGLEAYEGVWTKAGALMHSLVNNHALVDGNKRAGFACAAIFLHLNGHALTLTQDEAYDLTMLVATGQLADPEAIGRRLAGQDSMGR